MPMRLSTRMLTSARTLALAAAGAMLPLAACAPPPAPIKEEPVPACPQTRNWVAWVDAMPGPGNGPTLIVEGEIALPPGRRATLQAGPTDRMMPPGQRFALVVEPGAGPGGWQKVRGEIAPAQTQYRAVIVGCEGRTIAEIGSVTTAY